MTIIILLSIIIILTILLFIIVTRDDSKKKEENKEEFYLSLVKIIDALQKRELDGVEDLCREIVDKDTSKAHIYVILANILREKGHISEAINIHKNVLKRPIVEEDKEFKSWVLGNLSEDFRKGGMIDRALRTYEDAFRLNSSNKTLIKRYILLCKQVGEYERLLSLLDIYNSLGGFKNIEDYKREVAFVYNEIGEKELKDGNVKKAVSFFNKGISIYNELYPAYINLATINLKDNSLKARKFLENLIEIIPNKAFLALPMYKKVAKNKFKDVCETLLNRDTDNWRVRLELGRFYMENGERLKGLKEFRKCIELAPMVLMIHQEVWKYLLKHPDDIDVFKEYAMLLDRVLVFNNPFICSKCNYKSSEFLWKCPYCHEFDTFVELKI